MTARQQQARDLRASGLTWAEVGRRLGCSASSAWTAAERTRANAYQNDRKRVLGLTYYIVTRSAEWWMPTDDDAAEVLRVEVSA